MIKLKVVEFSKIMHSTCVYKHKLPSYICIYIKQANMLCIFSIHITKQIMQSATHRNTSQVAMLLCWKKEREYLQL